MIVVVGFLSIPVFFFFFFNDTATTEIYTLSLHDALPISVHSMALFSPMRRSYGNSAPARGSPGRARPQRRNARGRQGYGFERSEEHTSELQSRSDLVCRLLLEKKKKKEATARHDSILVQS